MRLCDFVRCVRERERWESNPTIDNFVNDNFIHWQAKLSDEKKAKTLVTCGLAGAKDGDKDMLTKQKQWPYQWIKRSVCVYNIDVYLSVLCTSNHFPVNEHKKSHHNWCRTWIKQMVFCHDIVQMAWSAMKYAHAPRTRHSISLSLSRP